MSDRRKSHLLLTGLLVMVYIASLTTSVHAQETSIRTASLNWADFVAEPAIQTTEKAVLNWPSEARYAPAQSAPQQATMLLPLEWPSEARFVTPTGVVASPRGSTQESILEASRNWADYAAERAVAVQPAISEALAARTGVGANLREHAVAVRPVASETVGQIVPNWPSEARYVPVVIAPQQAWMGESIRLASRNWADIAEESAVAVVSR